ncbi:DNA mismatch repair protein MutT [Streptococcus suis]
MARKEMVTLTNMCLIEDKEGKVVVQIRDPKRYRWSGVAFPGGGLCHNNDRCLIR